jgi:hypothetical protein
MSQISPDSAAGTKLLRHSKWCQLSHRPSSVFIQPHNCSFPRLDTNDNMVPKFSQDVTMTEFRLQSAEWSAASTYE